MSLGNVVIQFTNWVWGIPMLLFLGIGGLFLTIRCNAINFIKLPYILKNTIGKGFVRSKDKTRISGFQAVTAALSSTLGTGNIVGAAAAVGYGGPGAIFWMWIIALTVSVVKYSEIVLAVNYREVNEKGEFSGGPMYYLAKGLRCNLMGMLYAVIAIITVLLGAAGQVGSCIDTMTAVNIPRNVAIVVFVVLVAVVVYGGFRSIVRVSEKVVPFMAVFYVIGCVAVLALNVQRLPAAFLSIFTCAFTPCAATGGFGGAAVATAIRWGVARGIYSNDAGNGMTSIAHANADVNHPAEQGMWGVFEVFFDTLIVCTLTALTVLCTGVWTDEALAGSSTLTVEAFKATLGNGIGGAIVSITLFFFVFTTVFVFCYFCEKQGERLFGIRAAIPMRILFLAFISYGGFIGFDALIQYIDFFSALMIFINTTGVLLMSGQIRRLTLEYFGKKENNL